MNGASVVSDQKTCRRCGRIQPSTAFPAQPRCRDGLSSWCKDCHREATRKTRVVRGEIYHERDVEKGYKLPRPTPITCSWCGDSFTPRHNAKMYCSEDCGRLGRNRLRKYGLTAEQFWAMFRGQSEACAICTKPIDLADGHSWHIDHDHESGEVRGILCRGCNAALGSFGDNAAMLRRAADYLDGSAGGA